MGTNVPAVIRSSGCDVQAEGWAFEKFYNSESARLAALPAWVHEYNHNRPHSAIGKRSPVSRLDDLAGHHN